MPVKYSIHSLAPASLFIYLNTWQSRAGTRPAHESTRMQCEPQLLHLEECKAFQNLVIASSIQNTLPQNQDANSQQMLKGHLCPVPDMRHLGVESPWCPENSHKPLWAGCGFGPTHNQAHLWICICSLGDAPGSRRHSGALVWTSVLTATLMFSSSLWLSSLVAAKALGKILLGFLSSPVLK